MPAFPPAAAVCCVALVCVLKEAPWAWYQWALLVVLLAATVAPAVWLAHDAATEKGCTLLLMGHFLVAPVVAGWGALFGLLTLRITLWMAISS